MTGNDYLQSIDKLGLTQVAAGRLFGSERSSRRWVKDGPPPMVAVLLRLMIVGNISVADVERAKQEERV